MSRIPFHSSSIFTQLFGLLLCILILWPSNCLCIAKFTNLQCQSLDEDFITFNECRLRAVKRNINEITVDINFLQAVQSNTTMRWQLLKKANGFKPFLYDVSVDVCDYLEKRNHPLLNIIFNTLDEHIGIALKCPLEKQITLQKFRFPEKILESLPLPEGEYAVYATILLNNIPRSTVKIYFSLTE